MCFLYVVYIIIINSVKEDERVLSGVNPYRFILNVCTQGGWWLLVDWLPLSSCVGDMPLSVYPAAQHTKCEMSW